MHSDLVLGTTGRDYRSISIIVTGEEHQMGPDSIRQPQPPSLGCADASRLKFSSTGLLGSCYASMGEVASLLRLYCAGLACLC